MVDSYTPLRCGQLFYGNGPAGYAILGVSPSAKPFSEAFSAFCRGLGTPHPSISFDRILMSRPVGNRVLMVCCTSGKPDSSGRPTLFFHGVSADMESLRRCGVDAFQLAVLGIFRHSSFSSNPVEDVSIAIQPMARTVQQASIQFPAIIRSCSPPESLIHRCLGNESLDRCWKTFSFELDPSADLQALAQTLSSVPEDVYVYDEAAQLLRQPTRPRLQVEDRPRQAIAPLCSNPGERTRTEISWMKLVLIASLILNAILLCFVHGKRDKSLQPEPANLEPLKIVQQAEPQPTGVFILESDRPYFSRLSTFAEELANTEYDDLLDIWTNSVDRITEDQRRVRDFLERCEPHVEWINRHFPVIPEDTE